MPRPLPLSSSPFLLDHCHDTRESYKPGSYTTCGETAEIQCEKLRRVVSNENSDIIAVLSSSDILRCCHTWTQTPVARCILEFERLNTKEAVMADAIKYGEWEVGFFQCFHDLVPNCCMAWCLPCVSIAQISSRIGTHRFATALLFTILLNIVMSAIFFVELFAPVDEEDGYDYDDPKSTQLSTLEYVTVSISVAGFLVYSVWVSDLRNNVRTRSNIPGNSCVDFLTACCCSCCTIAQMATHVKSYNPGSCDFGPPDTLPGFSTK